MDRLETDKGGAVTDPRDAALPSRQEIADEHRRNQAREIAEAVAADLAEMRKAAEFTLDEVAGEFGRGRAWLSKLETARIQEVSLADYLGVVSFLQGQASPHPAVALLRYLRTKNRKANIRLIPPNIEA